MDEIKLFEDLQPPPPPDATRMREAARARLTVAMNAPLAHPARRHSTVVAVAAAAALVAAGTGYGLTTAQGGPSARPSTAARGDSSSPRGTAAGLTAVHGCPGMYITAGTLEKLSGTRAIIQPANDTDHVNRAWQAHPVTVATSASTVITVPASGTVSDITDGSHVTVQGTWSGERLAATEVDIEADLPAPGSYGPPISPNARKIGQFRPGTTPPFAHGTVVDAHDGSFTVVMNSPLSQGRRVQVITSNSTKVVAKASASLTQLNLGANVVAVGQIGANGVLTASTVAESSSGMKTLLAGGPAKIRTSGCSAAAITTAAILAGA